MLSASTQQLEGYINYRIYSIICGHNLLHPQSPVLHLKKNPQPVDVVDSFQLTSQHIAWPQAISSSSLTVLQGKLAGWLVGWKLKWMRCFGYVEGNGTQHIIVRNFWRYRELLKRTLFVNIKNIRLPNEKWTTDCLPDHSGGKIPCFLNWLLLLLK